VADKRAPFLLLAHHRSGSNLLNDLLQAHPCIECLNEPFSMHTSFFREHDLRPWQKADFDPVLLHHDLPRDDELRAFLQSLHDYLASSTSSHVVGFKETGLFAKLEWLHAFMPGIKLIFLRRDPRAIVSSVLRSGLTGLWAYGELVPPAFRRHFPRAVLPAWPAGSAAAQAALVAMSVALRYALVTEALRSFEHCVVNFQDIVEQPSESLDALSDFLGVPAHTAPLHFLLSRQGNSRGGTFSSFREPSGAVNGWQRRLTRQELEAIAGVLEAAGWATWAARDSARSGAAGRPSAY
jgi:Sulfotransferase family